MRTIIFSILCLTIALLLVFALVGLSSAGSEQARQEDGNGILTVSIFYLGEWHSVGSPSYNETLSLQQLDLSRLPLSSPWVLLRVTHKGETAAHIDAASLDGAAPHMVYGSSEETALALRKLARGDNDLVDAQSKTLLLIFDLPTGGAKSFTLTARIAPQQISQIPFQFPLDNLYQTMTPDSAFYTYAWDSQPGKLTLDGDLAGENLNQPFFKEFCKTGSGHPDGYIYGWVRNDDQNLYVAIDFVPDNTMDGDKDYAKVYVDTPAGLHVFKVSVPEQQWGKTGFVYTPRAVYQHKTYEFSIPLSELGLSAPAPGVQLPIAFAAYGTVTPAPNSYPGLLDPDFGTGGRVTTDFGSSSSDNGFAVALQDDGKIVVAGYTSYNGGNFAVLRYTVTGTLDTSFGTGGKVDTDFGSSDYGQAVAIQDDGMIVVAGYSGGDFALARYTITGTLDNSFSADGKVTTDFSAAYDSGKAVAIQDDGKIVVAGGSGADFALARYTITGTLDTSFDTDGKVTTVVGYNGSGYSIAIQDDGKIVVAGTGGDDFALARYNADGAPDTSFGTDGKVTTDFGSSEMAGGVALQKNGKIVAAGYAGGGYGDFALARYTVTGALDTSFDTDGKVTTDFGGGDGVYGMAIQEDGKILVAGYNYGGTGSKSFFAAARYNTDGSRDFTFGTGGRANTVGVNYQGQGQGVALQSDHKIVIVGYSNNSDFMLVRFLNPRIYLPLVKR